MSLLSGFQDVGNPIILIISWAADRLTWRWDILRYTAPNSSLLHPDLPRIRFIPLHHSPSLLHPTHTGTGMFSRSLFLPKIRFSFYVTNHLNTFRKLLATNLNRLGWTNLKISLSGHPFKQSGHFILALMSASISLSTTSQQMNWKMMP